MFFGLGLIFTGTDGVGPRFHVMRSRTRFGRNRGVGSHFHVLRAPNSFSALPGASGPVFLLSAPITVFVFCAPGLIFGGTEGVRSRFHVMHSWTRFRRYRGCRVRFSCFAPPDSFSAVPRASGPVFMFCAPGVIFGGTEGVRYRFHILRFKTHFQRYRGRRVLFSRFELPDSFSAVPRASGPVFMFCAPGLVFGRTEGVRSRFRVLRARTYFRRYRGRRVPF
jgi:hypothetical protein